MRSFFLNLVIIFFLMNSVVYALEGNWTKVTKTQNTTFYVDLREIRTNELYVYFWILVDNKSRGTSTVRLIKGSCRDMDTRTILIESYDGPMAKNYGGRVYMQSLEVWTKVQGPGKKLLDLVCVQ